jgi:hypothetical protein
MVATFTLKIKILSIGMGITFAWMKISRTLRVINHEAEHYINVFNSF